MTFLGVPIGRLGRDEAIGYALLETNHLPGFAARGPAFVEKLREAGWDVTAVERDDPVPAAANGLTPEEVVAGLVAGVKIASPDGPVKAAGRVTCNRCNRPLQNVYYLADQPYGRICVTVAALPWGML